VSTSTTTEHELTLTTLFLLASHRRWGSCAKEDEKSGRTEGGTSSPACMLLLEGWRCVLLLEGWRRTELGGGRVNGELVRYGGNGEPPALTILTGESLSDVWPGAGFVLNQTRRDLALSLSSFKSPGAHDVRLFRGGRADELAGSRSALCGDGCCGDDEPPGIGFRPTVVAPLRTSRLESECSRVSSPCHAEGEPHVEDFPGDGSRATGGGGGVGGGGSNGGGGAHPSGGACSARCGSACCSFNASGLTLASATCRCRS